MSYLLLNGYLHVPNTHSKRFLLWNNGTSRFSQCHFGVCVNCFFSFHQSVWGWNAYKTTTNKMSMVYLITTHCLMLFKNIHSTHTIVYILFHYLPLISRWGKSVKVVSQWPLVNWGVCHIVERSKNRRGVLSLWISAVSHYKSGDEQDKLFEPATGVGWMSDCVHMRRKHPPCKWSGSYA